ncbi:MAG: beta-propeller domain-containing protein [Candidatus Heimdallarchaeaceae archaeon]|jgi:uncharacterized secreted protein with C-terminal beta-propeller domain
MKNLKTILPIFAVVLAALLLVLLLTPSNQPSDEIANTFDSIDDMESYIKKNTLDGGTYGGILEMAPSFSKGVASSADSAEPSGASDYSTTNIQVEGVDEADIIKNDGKYIYVVSGNKLVIVNAYPAENMEVLSEIEIENGSLQEIFINGNKLIAFSNDYSVVPYAEAKCAHLGCIIPPYYEESRTTVYIYDIRDKSDPELENEISVTGNYFSSRMIGDKVYVIANQYVWDDIVLPSVVEDGELDIIEPTDVYYTDIRDYGYQFTIVLAVDVDNGNTNEKAILTGRTHNIYVSQDNIYTTLTKYPAWYEDAIDLNTEKTLIHKISIDEMDIEYVASGEVPGRALNQFSMDESGDTFRIATTVGNMWNEQNPSKNNVYVLDEELNVLGELEDLAPGERIYSVRFIGNRCYMVTFKKVDPLFVIDLSDSENPNVLGKLKIPGYSDYLHPYDENHIIGIGKETIEAEGENRDFAWYQGVKMAIFDVSDVENPIELHKIVIGDRGTDSEALSNHKAFLFDRERELLVLPITLAEIPEEEKNKEYSGWGVPYGDYVFQGAYVYNINLEDGFELRGRVTHYEDEEVFKKSGYYFYGDRNVRRALYMDEILYTFSNLILKANDLDNLDEINSVDIPYEEEDYPIYYDEAI